MHGYNASPFGAARPLTKYANNCPHKTCPKPADTPAAQLSDRRRGRTVLNRIGLPRGLLVQRDRSPTTDVDKGAMGGDATLPTNVFTPLVVPGGKIKTKKTTPGKTNLLRNLNHSLFALFAMLLTLLGGAAATCNDANCDVCSAADTCTTCDSAYHGADFDPAILIV